MSEPITTQRVDHLAEMRRAIDATTSAAEKAEVRAAQIRDYFESCLDLYRRRALYQADQANRTNPIYDLPSR